MTSDSPYEQARLRALHSYHLLDTPPDEAYDDLARIAATICGTPIALITLVDRDRQWFKSRHGLEMPETPRDIAFCDHTIQGRELLVVGDAQADPRFRANPLVSGEPHIRFYAGAPLISPDGYPLGTLCVIDSRPRELDHNQYRALRALARQVMTQIELRGRVVELAETIEAKERAEKLMRAGEERYRRLIDNAHDIIYSTDALGRFQSFNGAAIRIMKRGSDEMSGLHFLELVDPDHRAAARHFYFRQFRSKAPNTYYEFPALTGDGDPIWLGQNVQLVFDDAGEIVGFQAVARDITERRRMEHNLAIARDAALDAARIRSEFLANMSHEIRTPMNGIIGMTGLLIGTVQTAEQREYTGIIDSSTRTLLGIINDILDFSKMDAGKIHLETHDVNIGTLVRSTVALFTEPAALRGIALGVVIDESLPLRISCDPGRIRQVLNNLISNAIKFTPKGKVVVHARAAGTANDGTMLRFEVSDTGIGIESARLPALFEPFIQGDGSTTRRYGGTGLGLSISRHLVEMMGGRLGARSQPGEGSTFWFTVRPAIAGIGTPRPNVTAEPSAPANDAGMLRPAILVAEDSLVNQKVTLGQLAALGYRADLVTNGREVLERLRARRYDIILMDCHMPELDGFEATRAIRADENPDRHTVIIALTADAMSGTRERCLAAGMDAYVAKPVNIDELDAVLRDWQTLRPTEAAGELEPQSVSRRDDPLDRAAIDMLREISGEGGELFVELIDLFVADSPHHLHDIRSGALEGDAQRVARASHKLCGSAGVLGATTLAGILAGLENAIRDGSPVDLQERAGAIERELADVMDALLREKG